MAGAGEALKDGAVSGREALAQAASEAERVKSGLSDAAREQQRLNREAAATQRTIQGVGRTAGGVSKAVSGAARGSIAEIGAGVAGIAETAATALGPVGIAATAIAAVVGAAGAASKALADAAVTRQRSAFSKGLTPGQEASFGVYGQQFLGSGALQAAANAQTSFGSAGQLATLGIDFNKARGMSAGDLAFKMLGGAVSAAQAQPTIPLGNLPQVQAYLALGGDIGDVRNALAMGPGALAAAQAETARNAGRLNINPGAVKNAATLKKAVEGAGVAAQSFAINKLTGADPAFAALLDAATGGKGGLSAVNDLGNTIERHAVPAIQAFNHALNVATGGLLHKGKNAINSANDWINSVTGGALTSDRVHAALKSVISRGSKPIMGTAEAAVVAAAQKAGVDPLIALADAAHESGMNPKSRVRDFYSDGSFAGYSTGLFQLNDNGEGRGMSVKDMMDPMINATVAMKNFAAVSKAHPNWSPGEIAFAAEGAAAGPGGKWKTAYINDVNARYQRLVNQMRNSRPPTVNVKVSNPTPSRVSVSINAAAVGNQ